MAERKILLDAILVGAVNRRRAAQAAPALGTFGLAKVSPAGAAAHDLAAGGDLEPLGGGLLRFDAFGTSHKSVSFQKERAIYVTRSSRASGIFSEFREVLLASPQGLAIPLLTCAQKLPSRRDGKSAS